MRVAVLADIHGNAHALEAVLERAESQRVDQIVVAGDTVGLGPNSKACWDRVMKLGCPILRGNHERNLYTFGTPEGTELKEERFKPLAYDYAQFTEADINAVRALPLTYSLPDLLIVHALPHDDRGEVPKGTSEAELRNHFAAFKERFIVRGHNHRYYTLSWDERTLYTIGSLGCSFDANREAAYAILEQTLNGWQLEPHSVTYDVEAAVAQFDNGYLEGGYPMSLLFRQQLIAGKSTVMPFFKRYGQRLEQNDITLEQAVLEFLDS